MAPSQVTLNPGAIRAHMQGSPFAGTGFGARRGFAQGDANALAARMVLQARLNAATFNQRTSRLVTSVIPVVRPGRGGAVEVGVATTVEYGYWLEAGTDFHFIPSTPFVSRGIWDSGFNKGVESEVPEKWKLEGRFHQVPHPGNQAYHWMSNAVRSVVPGLPVHVRKLF